MSASAPAGRAAAREGATRGTPEERELERLTSLLDPAFLQAINWDPTAQTFAPPPEHPQLGFAVCRVAGCDVVGGLGLGGLCATCRPRYLSSGLDLSVFVAIERVRAYAHASSALLCAVADCGRPCVSAPAQLCAAHEDQQQKLGLPLAAFLTHPQVRPMPSFGVCRVAACPDPAHGRRGLCRPHDSRWHLHRRRNPGRELDFDHWCRTQRPILNQGDRVVLLGLPPLVQTQLLYGLQERSQRGSKTKLDTIRGLGDLLRLGQVRSVFELAMPPDRKASPQHVRRREPRVLAADVRAAVRRAFSSPELERQKDKWDMVVFGHRGTLDFTGITQPWLRQAALDWASEDAPRRRGNGATAAIQTYLHSVARLSASLRLQRDDHGMDPTLLGRRDIVAFLNRLAHLEALDGDGKLTAYQRRKTIRCVGKLVRDCRAFGLARPGGPLAGLPDDFAVRDGDAPKAPDRSEEGRGLPPIVLEQLVAALPRLEACSSREASVAVQLLIDTGRRPDEICKLRWDCLEQDPDGKHALIYADFKNSRIGLRLAIADATARLIVEQQHAVRARFLNTPLGELVLLPRAHRNPHGTHPLSSEAVLAKTHRGWVDALPTLRSGEHADDGTELEFDKAKVFLYAYRHTYAQRHADAGTRVEDLSELMGHDGLATIQTYYRITARRTRAAVDKLAALQFDGRGNRTWHEGRALLEHEHQRLAVGQVAVPFGICTEPSNVKAGGHACPFRFRCPGCGHFRSNPSYLPELRGYLDMLLRNRERVRAAVELEDWARAEAMPSDQEISRVRALIRRAETDLEQLSDEERQQIDEACRIVRATRQTVHLGMPTIRPPDLDPTLPTNREDLA
jgi:integrase